MRLEKQEKCCEVRLLGCRGSDGGSFLKLRRAAHSAQVLTGA